MKIKSLQSSFNKAILNQYSISMMKETFKYKTLSAVYTIRH